jgi:hypothetical protein
MLDAFIAIQGDFFDIAQRFADTDSELEKKLLSRDLAITESAPIAA